MVCSWHPIFALTVCRQYGFIAHCRVCRESRIVPWDCLPQGCLCASPTCGRAHQQHSQQQHLEGAEPTGSLGSKHSVMALAGPVWVGPLHCRQTVSRMAEEAEARGWAKAEQTLRLMVAEAHPALPPWFIKVDEV